MCIRLDVKAEQEAKCKDIIIALLKSLSDKEYQGKKNLLTPDIEMSVTKRALECILALKTIM